MTRADATLFARTKLNEHGLQAWTVRLNHNADSRFLGLCSYKDTCIILSSHHIDIHPAPSVENTILHEVAHALVGPGHGHDDVWAAKAREIGCDNTLPCSNLSLSPDIINAIRSGADVEVTFEEQVIRTPKYNITRLQDRCDDCGVVATTAFEMLHEADDFHPDIKVVELECGHFVVRSIPKGTPFHTFQMGGDSVCEHEWLKNVCMKCGRFRPFEFQLEGMRFLEAALAVNNGGGVFDEMGLGKTIQAGGYIYFHKETWPTLWMVKSGLKHQFAMFILGWLGNEHVPQIIKTSKDYLIPGLKHYIIGYDMLVQKTRVNKKTGKISQSGFDISKFDNINGPGNGVKCVVLDECQQIKNVDSSRTQMVRKVVRSQSRKVIALSGTPWKNKGSELYPVLNLLDYYKFNDEARFKRNWVESYWHNGFQKEGGILPRRIKEFKEYTKDIVIRRERTEVMAELPLVNRTKLLVTMDLATEQMYDNAVDDFVKWYEEQASNISGMMIIAAMQKMRHLVALAKIPATLEYVDEFISETDRKIVVFAHHKDVQYLLHDDLFTRYNGDVDETNTKMPVLKLTSEMNGEERYYAQKIFNESKRAILIASTLAAGEGLNLQTCADCIIHERQWNPANEEQAEGRFIRIGQTAATVNAVYAHCEGLTTIDPQLDVIVERKRLQFHAAMNSTEMKPWNEDSMIKELADVIVAAHRRKRNK